jgi:hypothetical protein
MKIEITKGENNPVTDFFSSPSNTPVTDEMKCLSLIEVMELPMERRTIALRVLQAIKERDEAREDASHWKIEYEITKTIRKNQVNNMNRLFFALGLLTGAAVTWILGLGLKILI